MCDLDLLSVGLVYSPPPSQSRDVYSRPALCGLGVFSSTFVLSAVGTENLRLGWSCLVLRLHRLTCLHMVKPPAVLAPYSVVSVSNTSGRPTLAGGIPTQQR
jgi:hypothetical protein